MSDKITKEYPATISALKSRIESLSVDVKQAESTRQAGYESFVIAGKKYAEQKDIEAALVQIAGSLQLDEPKLLGDWRGFTIIAVRQGNLTESKTYAVIQGKGTYKVKLSSKGNLIKIRNEIDGLAESLEVTKSRLQTEIKEMNTAGETLKQPWPYEEEFQEKSARLIEVDAQLSMDADSPPPLEQTVIVQPEASSEGLPRFDDLLEEGRQFASEHNQNAAVVKPQTPQIEGG